MVNAPQVRYRAEGRRVAVDVRQETANIRNTIATQDTTGNRRHGQQTFSAIPELKESS